MPSDESGESIQTSREIRQLISRRRFIGGAVGIGTVGLAGCSGDENQGLEDTVVGDSNTPTNTDATMGTEGSDSTPTSGDMFTLVAWLGRSDPTTFQFNPYSSNYFDKAIFEDFGHFNLRSYIEDGESDYFYRGLGDWTVEDPTKGGTVVLTPNSERTWHDGDPVVAEDIYTKLRLDMEFGGLIADYISDIQMGDGVVEATLSRNVNTKLFDSVISGVKLNTKRDIYRQWVEKYEDASTDNAKQTVSNDLSSWKLNDPVGTGPYKLTQMDVNQFVFDVHDGHPAGAKMDINGMKVLTHSSNEDKWQYALGEECDMMESGTPTETAKEILATDTFDEMARFHFLNGLALTFNHEDELYGQQNVRRALAYIINRKRATEAGGLGKGSWGQIRYPQESIHGVYVGTQAWFDDAFYDSLTDYGYDEVRRDAAAEELRQAGYERNGNTWVDGSGEPLKIELNFTPFSAWSTCTQYLKQNLTDFGLQAELNSQEVGSYFGNLNGGNYGFTCAYWGNKTHPYYQFQMPFYSPPRNWLATNHPGEVEIPMPVGDSDGSVETVDVHGLMEEVSTTNDEAREKEISRTLAWAYNQSIPQIPIWFRYGQLFLNTSDWEFPEMDAIDTKMFKAQIELPTRGYPRGRK